MNTVILNAQQNFPYAGYFTQQPKNFSPADIEYYFHHIPPFLNKHKLPSINVVPFTGNPTPLLNIPTTNCFYQYQNLTNRAVTIRTTPVYKTSAILYSCQLITKILTIEFSIIKRVVKIAILACDLPTVTSAQKLKRQVYRLLKTCKKNPAVIKATKNHRRERALNLNILIRAMYQNINKKIAPNPKYNASIFYLQRAINHDLTEIKNILQKLSLYA